MSSTYFENEEIRGRSEVDRRGKYIDELTQKIANYPALIELVVNCLHNNPHRRPSTEQLLTRLEGIRAEVEGNSGGSAERLGVMVANEMRENERRRGEAEREMQV